MDKVLVFMRRKTHRFGNSPYYDAKWISDDGLSAILSLFEDEYLVTRKALINDPDCLSITEMQLIKPKPPGQIAANCWMAEMGRKPQFIF